MNKYTKIFTAFLLFFSSNIFANDQCTKMANEMSNYSKTNASAIHSDYLNNIKKQTKIFLDNKGKDAEGYLLIVKNKIEHSKHYEALVTEYTENLPITIANVSDDPEQANLCNDKKYAFENMIDEQLDIFSEKLAEIILLLEKRVELETLSDNEGLVVIAIRTNYRNINTEYILKSESFFGDNATIGPISTSYYFDVIKLASGKYYWEKIKWNKGGNGQYNYFNFDDTDLNFQVEAGKLNFAGEFISKVINERGYGDISDRSSKLIDNMKETFPLLLKNYDWSNSMAAHDPYLMFIKKEMFGG
jgi:hypothetical protein